MTVLLLLVGSAVALFVLIRMIKKRDWIRLALMVALLSAYIRGNLDGHADAGTAAIGWFSWWEATKLLTAIITLACAGYLLRTSTATGGRR
jgi:predicted benzoate:H+ symporter BenE